jgi:hypothetical protein
MGTRVSPCGARATVAAAAACLSVGRIAKRSSTRSVGRGAPSVVGRARLAQQDGRGFSRGSGQSRGRTRLSFVAYA